MNCLTNEDQSDLKIALAQIEVVDGDVIANTEKHLQIIEMAAHRGANHVVFPELSLTGYSLSEGRKWTFSMTEKDSELKKDIIFKLRDTCNKYNITGVIGIPFSEGGKVNIASVIMRPGLEPLIYTKKHLHGAEKDEFFPGDHNPIIKAYGKHIGFAICADTMNESHPKEAASSGVGVYIASVLISKNGYEKDSKILSQVAKDNEMIVCIANFAGVSGGYDSAGKSGVWNKTGDLIACLPDNSEGLLVVEI